MADIDLDAYLNRIGYTGAREPTLETLRGLHRAHLTRVPFENLDVVLRRPIRLDPAALQQKLVANRRGGYCFESNALFMYALQALGFRVTALAARVLYERPEVPLPPRSHMLLMVDLEDGLYLADVAFGGQTPPQPLPFVVGVEQATSHEPYRLRRTAEGELDLEVRIGADWKLLYRFTLHPQLPVDFEAANWHVSTHPESYFVNNLIAAMPAEGRRYTLFNREFRTRTPDGQVAAEPLADDAVLAAVLEEKFGLSLDPADMATLIRALTPPA